MPDFREPAILHDFAVSLATGSPSFWKSDPQFATQRRFAPNSPNRMGVARHADTLKPLEKGGETYVDYRGAQALENGWQPNVPGPTEPVPVLSRWSTGISARNELPSAQRG